MSARLTLKLNNGMVMPMAGIGTFLLSPDEAEASCVSALADGYRLIDTANAYVNERAVGRAMKRSGLKREEIFLETKLWPSFYEQADAVEKTLERLDTSYIDLLLIHQPAGNYVAGYRLMEKAYKEVSHNRNHPHHVPAHRQGPDYGKGNQHHHRLCGEPGQDGRRQADLQLPVRQPDRGRGVPDVQTAVRRQDRTAARGR